MRSLIPGEMKLKTTGEPLRNATEEM